jgi:hypothetical protein
LTRANEPFYQTFQVSPGECEGRLVYELGNRQWDIPRLRELLENVLPDNNAFDDVLDHLQVPVKHQQRLADAVDQLLLKFAVAFKLEAGLLSHGSV